LIQRATSSLTRLSEQEATKTVLQQHNTLVFSQAARLAQRRGISRQQAETALRAGYTMVFLGRGQQAFVSFQTKKKLCQTDSKLMKITF
jgi:hypothetical protein